MFCAFSSCFMRSRCCIIRGWKIHNSLSGTHGVGVKIALKLHLLLALHLIKRSHTPAHDTLVSAQGGTASRRAQLVSWKVKLTQTLSDES